MSPGAESRPHRPDETSLTSLRDTDALLDVLAGRVELAQLDGVRREDPLVAALAGWVEVIDAEVSEATAREARATRKGRGARRNVRGPVAGPVAGVAAGRVVPTRPGRDGRVPWWLLSASAAAVIAVMGVGAGLQDTSLFVPGSSTQQSVQSVESVLTAARLAAEAGDVAGAALLLERARAMVAELPATEQAQFEVALEVVERGLRIAEEAVRRGEPVPPLPRPDLPGVTDPDGVVPSAQPDRPSATPADPADPADPDQPTPTRRPTEAPGVPGDPGAPPAGAPDRPSTPAPAPTPTTGAPGTPTEPAPAPTPTTATPVPPGQPGRPAEPGKPAVKPTSKATSKPTTAPTSRPTSRPTSKPTPKPDQADADRSTGAAVVDDAPAATPGKPAGQGRTATQTRRAAAPEQLPPAP